MTTRRQVLAAAVAAPIAAVAKPGMAQQLVCSTHDPIAEYIEAFHGYDEDNGPSVSRHAAASRALHDWQPTTATDMLRKVVAMLDDNGTPPETTLALLIEQVDRVVIDHA
ncbi:MAG: hypothetical protein C0494_12610 [Sphingobium sp.]|nr:hypothetical protein [Sphingobium sp.]